VSGGHIDHRALIYSNLEKPGPGDDAALLQRAGAAPPHRRR
jgi:hypothetical protein